MKRLKIAIIGKGTAGCLSVVYLANTSCQIDWYYDPTKKTQLVGEGSTLVLPYLLRYVLPQSELYKVNGSLKLGVDKRNWSNNDFYHDFVGGTGYHFDAGLLQDLILDKLADRVTIIESSVSHDDIDADYIIDCTGTPSMDKHIQVLENIPVNTAYVNQCWWDEPKFERTLTIATEHGWVFGIPLQNRLSVGYLYNSDISTAPEVLADVENIYREFDVTPSTDNFILPFKSYIRHKNFDGRVVYNGNASFFLEPIEATSTQFMFDILTLTGKKLFRRKMSDEELNRRYHEYATSHQNIILCHYYNNSNYKNVFWDTAKQKSQRHFSTDRSQQSLKGVVANTNRYSHWAKVNWDLHKSEFALDLY